MSFAGRISPSVVNREDTFPMRPWPVFVIDLEGDGIHIELGGPDDRLNHEDAGMASEWYNRKGRKSTNVFAVVAIPTSPSETPRFIFCYAGAAG